MIFKTVQRNDRLKAGFTWRDVFISICVLAACSFIGLLFFLWNLSEANIISIYILGILLIASLTSHWKYGAISSVVGVILFNCLYADPIFNFYVYDMQYAITMAVMLIASLITNYVMTLFRYQLDIAHEAEAERLRANLLRAVSHDLRTPLTSISGNADILLNNGDQIKPDLRKQLYKDIYDDSEWLINLVENLLFVTRIENGVMSIHTEPEVLQEIIPEALACFAKRAKEHNISLEMPEASGVYLMALSTILMITCIIRRASIFTTRSSSGISREISCPLPRLARHASVSGIISCNTSGSVWMDMTPFSMRVTKSKFSTRLISHSESS